MKNENENENQKRKKKNEKWEMKNGKYEMWIEKNKHIYNM